MIRWGATARHVAIGAVLLAGCAHSPSAPPSPTPSGFPTGDWATTSPSGETVRFCAWEADEGDERSRGLMGVTDMGACPAMAFRYDEPVEQRFYMFDTPMALSIAWFDADGWFVSSTDMAPCPVEVEPAACPRYAASGAYTVAVEVPSGRLVELGLVSGARLVRLVDQKGL